MHLRYIDDDPESYPGIFDNAKFSPAEADKRRLIQSLEALNSGENLDQAVNVDGALRYFVGQVFLMNWDSYLGHTGHNYFLYEEEGQLSILPWDYNLAFGTYALGMSEPIRDPNVLINYPILTPAPGEHMKNRPLYHSLMQVEEYFQQYQAYFDWFLEEYVESGRLSAELWEAAAQIAPYVGKDPTAFCSYEDHRLAVETLEQACLLRGEARPGPAGGPLPPPPWPSSSSGRGRAWTPPTWTWALWGTSRISTQARGTEPAAWERPRPDGRNPSRVLKIVPSADSNPLLFL